MSVVSARLLLALTLLSLTGCGGSDSYGENPGNDPETISAIEALGGQFDTPETGIDLKGSKITDAGLELLKGISNLKVIDLSETAVTDKGLEQLKGISKLKYVDLSNTKTTDAGVAGLKAALPECNVVKR